LLALRLPLSPTLFPYTTLFRSQNGFNLGFHRHMPQYHPDFVAFVPVNAFRFFKRFDNGWGVWDFNSPVFPDNSQKLGTGSGGFIDRKSTRLNSSHVKISYAVFC